MSSYLMDGYHGVPAAHAPASERVTFMQRTYAHLGGAIIACVALEAFLLNIGAGRMFIDVLRATPYAFIGVMVAFLAAGYVAQAFARSQSSRAMQYLGLGLYVALEAVILLPILTYCQMIPKFHDLPMQAGILTLTVFGGLTAAVLISKKDFSFLGQGIMVVGFLMLGLVIVAAFTGLNLGVWFSVLGIGLAAACVLYDTSNVLHHYPTNMYVSASLELFASIATMFYYILRLLMSFASSD